MIVVTLRRTTHLSLTLGCCDEENGVSDIDLLVEAGRVCVAYVGDADLSLTK